MSPMNNTLNHQLSLAAIDGHLQALGITVRTVDRSKLPHGAGAYWHGDTLLVGSHLTPAQRRSLLAREAAGVDGALDEDAAAAHVLINMQALADALLDDRVVGILGLILGVDTDLARTRLVGLTELEVRQLQRLMQQDRPVDQERLPDNVRHLAH